jgi:hypothetical protein
MNEKGNLYKDMQSRTGKKPASDFNLMEMIGKTALVQVIHNESKDGKVYANINNILPSDHKQKPVNPTVQLSLQDFDMKEFSKIPERLAKKVDESPEMQEIRKKEDNERPEKEDSSDLPF